MWPLKTPQRCFPYKGGTGFLTFSNLTWYWPSKRKLMSIRTWLVNWGLTAGIDPNWKLLYSVAARLHTSIAPLQVNSFRLSNVSSPTEHSCNIQLKFSNNHDSLYSLQWKPGLVTTWPYSSLECLNRWSYQVITRDFKTLCVGGSLLCFPYNTVCCMLVWGSRKTYSACCRRIRKTISKPKDTHIH